MVKTNRLKKIDLNSGGMTKLPNCPRMTATLRMQAVVPSANPLNLTRPRIVPIATDKRRKISGAEAMIDFTVLITADSQLGPTFSERPLAEFGVFDSDQDDVPHSDHFSRVRF